MSAKVDWVKESDSSLAPKSSTMESPSSPASKTATINKPQAGPSDLPFVRDDPTSSQKAKRRRTSPQDHIILEAAYLKNSKPDKSERTEIVSQVQMTPKEVQIWFQNRRQNDRRRSKPLDPQTLMAHMRKPESTPVATATPGPEDPESEDNHISASHHAHPATTPSTFTEAQPSPTASESGYATKTAPSEDTQQQVVSTLKHTPVEGLDTPPDSTQETTLGQDRAQTPPLAPNSGRVETSPSGSGRKRDHAEMSHETLSSSHVLPPSAESVGSKPKGPLKRSSSVRLSVTADGAVKIRTTDESTPSPSKERALPPTALQNAQNKGLRRSLSLFEDNTVQQVSSPGQRRLPGAGFGRSRDTRTWEFYCDASSKDALSTQVEAERNGSAVGAINLIRSNNNKVRGSALNSSGTRGNIPTIPPKSKAARPKMERAKSSLARLQHADDDVSSLKGSKEGSRHVRLPSGDSDKENWAPGTRLSTNPLRRTQPTNTRRSILQSSEVRDARQAKSSATASSSKADARGDDLDCIQGLLSLSQGCWGETAVVQGES